MAEDKPGDDDLFEDLDKFFAPIKDVDWDEPAEPGSRAHEEEHVAVHAPEATPEPEPEPGPDSEPPADAAVASTTPDPSDAEEAAGHGRR